MRHALIWLAATLFCSLSSAQEIPQTSLKVLGSLSARSVYRDVEVPFWSETLVQHSKNRITVELKAFDEVGIKGADLLRLLGQGVAQVATVPLSYYLTDQPINEAINLAGLVPDVKSAKAVSSVFEPVLAETYRGAYGVRLLGVVASSPQLVFCRAQLLNPQQLKGRTVRTSTRSQAFLMQALGAKAKTLSMSEASKAFEDKSIDCAISSSMSAFNAGWFKWAKHIFALPLGWNHQVYVVNQTAWDKFDPPLQEFLSSELKLLFTALWDYSIADNKKGIDCLTGAKACPVPTRAKMILVNPKPEDYALIKDIAKRKTLPAWAKQCNESCVDDFNTTIGKTLGVVAKH